MMKDMEKPQSISDMELVLDMKRVLDKIPNRYEFIVVISKFAHIIARRATEEGVYLRRKPYLIAAEALLKNEIPYETSRLQPPEEEPKPAKAAGGKKKP